MDNSFLRFSQDFNIAKNGDNPAIATLPYDGFIQMLPNETFFQISNSATPINFAGGITVELIDKCGNVQLDITNNFFYEIFSDSNGVDQIAYEFGNINTDFGSKVLYLKITDTTNFNVWYSTNFILTTYKANLSARFDYWSDKELNGIAYDIMPYKQSIRFSNFYFNDDVDEENASKYTQYNGNEVEYRSIITPLDEYSISSVDTFTYRRLMRLCQSPFIYLNNSQITKSDISKEKRIGDTNWFTATFVCNPKYIPFTFEYQFYDFFTDVSRFVANNSVYTLSGFNTAIGVDGIYIDFNKAPSVLPTFQYKLYKDNVLVLTASASTITTNRLTLDDISGYTFANGSYSLVVNANTVYNGAEFWDGFLINTWTWTIQDGEFDADDFTNDFLID